MLPLLLLVLAERHAWFSLVVMEGVNLLVPKETCAKRV